MNKAQDRFADQIMWMLHEKRDKSINVWKKAGFEWITEPWPRLQAENSLIPPELMDEVMRILREHTFSLQNQLTILKNCDRVTAACDGHEFYVTDVSLDRQQDPRSRFLLHARHLDAQIHPQASSTCLARTIDGKSAR